LAGAPAGDLVVVAGDTPPNRTFQRGSVPGEIRFLGNHRFVPGRAQTVPTAGDFGCPCLYSGNDGDGIGKILVPDSLRQIF
jgi:hypothetical protein